MTSTNFRLLLIPMVVFSQVVVAPNVVAQGLATCSGQDRQSAVTSFYRDCTPGCSNVNSQPSCQSCLGLVPSTSFEIGTNPGDLKIKVVGDQFNKLELYFRDEVRTLSIDSGANLHCNWRISFAKESDLGAFSVRYGAADDIVQLFAWKKGGSGGAVTLAPSTPITLKAGNTVLVEWITTKTAKLRSGSCPEVSMIVRFSDADTPWQRFDEATQTWKTLN